MFTIDQIHQAFGKVKSGADFPQLVQDLKRIGVSHYDNYVEDGRTTYYGKDGFVVYAEAKYPALKVSENSSATNLKHALLIHQQGKTDYPTFCKHAAEAGVEKWTSHMIKMNVAYFNKQGNTLWVEAIPQV
jgi:uncharacterized protein YbcV (DUF1398 family)